MTGQAGCEQILCASYMRLYSGIMSLHINGHYQHVLQVKATSQWLS